MKGGRLFTLVICVVLMFSITSTSVFAVEPTIVINEVLFDPEGADTGFEWIELYNSSCEIVDVSGYTITASSADYYVFEDVTLQPHSYTTIHWRTEGQNTVHDIFTGTDIVDSNMGNTSGYVALFLGDVRSFTTIRDYVSYGLPGQTWSMDAIEAGLWVATETVLIGDSGQSIGLNVDGVRNAFSDDWGVQLSVSPGDYNNDSVKDCIVADPTPTPTVSPTPFPTPTVIPTITVTPSPTPIVSTENDPTPTPMMISENATLSIPHEIIVNEEVLFSIEGKDFPIDQKYVLKIEASPQDGEWYFATTKGVNGQYYSWNSAWSNFPTFRANQNGLVTVTGMFKIKSGSVGGQYNVRAKIKKVDGLESFYSSQETVSVTEPTPHVVQPTPSRTVDTIDDDSSSETVSLINEIGSIVELQGFEFGTNVRVHGTVTAPVGLLGKGLLYVSDKTDGIQVLLPSGFESVIEYGDSITLVGEYGQKYGESVIRVVDVENIMVNSNETYIEPLVLEADFDLSQYEGQLVSIYGEVSETSGDTFYINVDGQEMRVLVKESTGIQKPSMRVGYYVLVKGVVSSFKGPYRILPRFQDDLFVSKEPFDKVLGVMVLPKTGRYGLLGLWVMLLGLGMVFLETARSLSHSMINKNRQQ